MLQSLRKHSKHPIAKVFLVLVLIAFAGLGLGSFVPSLQFNKDYITAGDTSIEIQEIATQFNKLRAEVAPNLSVNEAIESGYLDLLITFLSNEAIIMEEANSQGITVTREYLKKSLLENKRFMDEDGKFSGTKFQMSLLNAGVSEEKYLELLGRNIIKDQLTVTISESAKVSEKIMKLIAAKNLEKRDATLIDLKLTPLSKIENPSESELIQFYDNTSSSWREPTRRIGKYFYLDPINFVKDIEISGQDLIDEFDIRRTDYIKEETRSINQMIFDTRDEAQMIFSKIKNGSLFETIVKEKFNDQETLIKDIKKSDLIDEVSLVVFDLKLDEVSSIIESDIGFHLIKLNEINQAINPKFDDIKEQLENDVKLERATDLIYDIANYADDEFSSGSSIEEISKQKKLDIVFTEPLDKNGLNQNKEIPENPLFSDKIFLDVLWNNIEDEISINETEDGRFFALVLKEEIKEYLPKFNDIKIKLENAWKQTKAIEKTLNLAGELSSSNDLIKFANENQMNVSQIIGASQNDPSYPRPQIIKSLFGIEKIGDNQIAATKLGISVIRFDKVTPASTDEINNLSKILTTPFNQSLQNDLSSALISKLGEKHKLEVNKSLILQALGLSPQ